MTDRLHVYCDGSCPKPNGAGGWAFIILKDNDYIVRSGGFGTGETNQTMELCAGLEALRQLHWGMKLEGAYPIKIISDSQYFIKGMTIWRSAWRRADYAGIMNLQWWKPLHDIQDQFSDLEFEWVKGHGSSRWNRYVDRLAGEAMKQARIQHQMET